MDNQCFMYQILMHRLGCNGKKDAILFINKGMRLSDNIKKLKAKGFFSEILELPLLYSGRRSENANEQDIIKYYNAVFSKIKYTLNSFEDIFVMNDNWDGDINLYLNLTHLNYTWIQVSKNLIDLKPQYVSDAFSKIAIKYKSHTPFAAFAKPCLLKDSDESQNRLKEKKYTVWDIGECINTLSEKQLEYIAYCYDVNIKDYSSDKLDKSTLVLLNSYGYSIRSLIEFKYHSKFLKKVLGFDENIDFNATPYAKLCSIMTRMAMDIYTPDTQYYFVKLHPNEPCLSEDEIKFYYGDKAFPFNSMPFELIGRLFKLKKIKFDSLLTYAHGIDSIVCNHNYVLRDTYCFTWFYYCSIFISLFYATKCKIENIYCSKILISQIEFLSNRFKLHLNVNEISFLDYQKIENARNSIFLCNLLDEVNIDTIRLAKIIDKTCAICFLNTDLSEYFFDDSLYYDFASIQIEKIPTSFRSFNLQRNEVIWIYAKDINFRNIALNFEFKQELRQSGYTVQTAKQSVASCTIQFRRNALLNSIYNLSKNIKNTENILKIISFYDERFILKNALTSCTNLLTYLQILNLIKNKYLIILSIKDTPGDHVPYEIIEILKSVGFTKFSTELWKMYIGIIYNGKTVIDISGKNPEDTLTYNATDLITGTKLSIKSSAWRKENIAEIIINDKDYAVNSRGLNIVVYDLKNNDLIDSVGFDYHVAKKCIRK